MSSYLRLLHNRSMRILSRARSFPSMLISIPYSVRTLTNTSDVNWLPWSVLKIAGQPYSSIVSRKRFAYYNASIVLNIRQLKTFLENQSITAIRYTFPDGSFIYVISVDHTWFGYLITLFLSRYGYFLLYLQAFERFLPGNIALTPNLLITRRTVFSVVCPPLVFIFLQTFL
jgi:hypothetical protein